MSCGPPGGCSGVARNGASYGKTGREGKRAACYDAGVATTLIQDHPMKLLVAFGALLATISLALAGDAENSNRRNLLAQAPQVCTQVYQPVCGTDPAGKRMTYANDCFARAAKATNVTPGECPK